MKISLNVASLKGDLFGGLTAGIVALPLALAFGVQSGMGAAAGLYGAIGLGIFAAIFGGTNTQVSGPTGPMTVISTTVIMSLIATKGSLENAMPAILLTFVLAGVFLILMGVIRIGQYIKYIPYPVVSGFMTGIGIIIILFQIFPMVGMESPKNIMDIVKNIPNLASGFHLPSLITTLVTMGIIYLFPYLTKMVPSTLVALIIMTVATVLMNSGVKIIGNIPTNLPKLNLHIFEGFSEIQYIWIPAITLAALGAIDSLLTSVVADNVTRTNHNSNRELIGQGIGNMVAGIIGGIPGAGATMRTLVNIKSGGTTKLSGAIHGLFLLLVLVGLGSLASKIPLPVLSGILLVVGIDIVDKRGLSHIGKITRPDAFVLIIVLALTVFVDLLQAVAAGMIISSVIFIKQMGDITQKDSNASTIMSSSEQKNLFKKYHIPEDIQGIVGIKSINGPLFFGNSEYFRQLGKWVGSNVKFLIIDMNRVPYIDQSGLYAMESLILSLEQKGVEVLLLHLKPQPENMMRNISLIPDLVENECIFDDEILLVEKIKSTILNPKFLKNESIL